MSFQRPVTLETASEDDSSTHAGPALRTEAVEAQAEEPGSHEERDKENNHDRMQVDSLQTIYANLRTAFKALAPSANLAPSPLPRPTVVDAFPSVPFTSSSVWSSPAISSGPSTFPSPIYTPSYYTPVDTMPSTPIHYSHTPEAAFPPYNLSPNDAYTPFPVHMLPPRCPITPSSGLPDVPDSPDAERARIEQLLGQTLLHNISLSPASSRNQATWPRRLSQDDKVLITLRCIKNCGFDHLGDFLAALFAPTGESTHDATGRVVSAFLRKRSRPGTQPVDIMRLMYAHRASEAYQTAGGIVPVSFPSLPAHARPRSQRLNTSLPAAAVDNSTRGDVLNWALSDLVLPRIDSEAETLLSHENSFSIHDGYITWDTLMGWEARKVEEILATKAPVLYSTLTTLCVSRHQRKRLAGFATGHPNNMDIDETVEGGTLTPEDEEAEGVDDVDIEGLKMRRDPWLATTFLILTGLHMRYQYATAFPTLLGMILFVTGAPLRAFRVLSRVGASVSYSTTLNRLKRLAKDASNGIRALGALLKDSQPSFLVLWDNVNKQHRSWRATLSHQTTMQSGTAATLVELEDVPDGALSLQPLMENIRKQTRKNLTTERLCEDVDGDHLRGIGTGGILRVWLKYIPPLKKHHANVEAIFTRERAVQPLRLRKSKIHSLRCSAIDEATTVGTWELLMDIIKSQLGILLEWLNNGIILACGDQLTVHRLRKAKLFRGKCSTPARRGEPFVALIQLWHMKWAFQKFIFRLGYKPEAAGKGVFGIFHDCALLGREKFNHKRCDFYEAHHILQDRFEALTLDALRLVCEEKTQTVHSANIPLLDNVTQYFAPGGPLADASYETVRDMATLVYTRYMTTKAYEACEDIRNWRLFGRHATPSQPGDTSPQDSSTTAPSFANTSPWSGDHVLRNNVAFMRTTLWYLEMCAAVAEGDIGRVFKIVQLLRFSFWGAGCTNYGNELLELACNFIYEFPEDLREAILNNYLVNPSGLSGHWQELDLLQEHCNYWLKRLFNSKSLDFDSGFLREVIGLNLRGFCDLREQMFQFFGITRPGRTHTEADTRADINRLGSHYRQDGVLQFHHRREQPFAVPDEFNRGIDKLRDGQLGIFLERTVADRSHVHNEVELVPEDPDHLTAQVDGEDDTSIIEPVNPIISTTGGLISIDRFNSDFDASPGLF